MQFENVHRTTFRTSSPRFTFNFSATEYARIIAMLESGATNAKRSSSDWVSSRSSTLIMSFDPIFLDGTFITSETGTDVSPERLSNSKTFRACPDGMGSMTVPFLIAVTRRMLCSSAIRHHLPQSQQGLRCSGVDIGEPFERQHR